MSYYVTQQTHDIGIRMALGADQVKVLKLVVGKGLVILFSALTIGVAVAFAFSRVIRLTLRHQYPRPYEHIRRFVPVDKRWGFWPATFQPAGLLRLTLSLPYVTSRKSLT
jgi:ABC-type antimicrobial peptide transport system permease subunit